jgi:undecaprenyl pyrophosphate synthase
MLFLWEYFVKRKSNAVGRSSIDRPVAIIKLANSEWSRKRQTVRGTAHFRGRRDNINITQLPQRFF